MDPTIPTDTTTTTQITDNTSPITPPVDANVVIAGAFGGTIPSPATPVISDTMPAFSFDQADFGVTQTPVDNTVTHDTIADPFAGGISSTITTPTPSENISFDLPTVATSTDIQDEFNLPSQDNTIQAENNIESPAMIDPTSTVDVAKTTKIPSLGETDIEPSDAINFNEEKNANTDPIPATIIAESWDNNDHEIQDLYDEFKQSFANYSTFKDSKTITLTGLRTDEDEINYTFSQTESDILSITKSNTSDILSFKETESGVKVMLNNDAIGYYGVEQPDVDTTHFLKEKLGKFAMMLTSEHEREERKQKEESKKIRESLRDF